jgi:hypothetical protein
MKTYIERNIPGRTESEKMLWLASAYADSARILMKAMLEDDLHSECGEDLVVSHLCRHALELYFKGAIGVAAGQINKRHHRLDKLYGEYKRLYADKGEFYFFDFLVEDWVIYEEDMFPDSLVVHRKVHDQRFRYPADKDGKAFIGFQNFNAQERAKQVETFSYALNHRAFFICQYGAKVQDFLDSC